jgi:MFS transporter, FSR family, fosmidomycin resistance protein
MERSDMQSTGTVHYKILWLVCLAHLINDTVTAIVTAMLPVFQKSMGLTYLQLGLIVAVSTVTASFLQPLTGILADKKPLPYLAPVGAALLVVGVLGLSRFDTYAPTLVMVGLIGVGSAVFHPEASRVAHAASGPKRGLGQSIFQVGGNFGQSLGPLMVALIFIPFGQHGVTAFLVLPLIAIFMLILIARWYAANRPRGGKQASAAEGERRYGALTLLVVIVIMRSWINSGISAFLPLYLVNVQNLSQQTAQYYNFTFLFAGAVGTFLGGMASDWFSKKKILSFSMYASIPFTLLIPYLSGAWLYLDVFAVGLISLCSFAVSVVYAQQLVPGRIGFVSGLMIGFAIGAGGVGATLLGGLADSIGIVHVIELMTLFPLIGTVLGFWLPEVGRDEAKRVQPGTPAGPTTA